MALTAVLFLAGVVWRASQEPAEPDDVAVTAPRVDDTVPPGTGAVPDVPTSFPPAPDVVVPDGGFDAAQISAAFGDAVWRVEVEGCGVDGHGSGFPVGPHHLVTNWHVAVVDTSPVLVNRAGEQRQGRVVGMTDDPDVALVVVDEPFTAWFGWADPASLIEGEPLVAMGFPVPAGDFTVTNLSIASFETSEDGVRTGIRVDGAIDYGNSGGPSLTRSGRVAGINTSANINIGGSAGGVFGGGTQVVPFLQSHAAVADELDGFVAVTTALEPDCAAVNPRDAQTYGDNLQLDALWDACTVGDPFACDDLYKVAAIGSEYEQYGRTCGGRLLDGRGYCAQRFLGMPMPPLG